MLSIYRDFPRRELSDSVVKALVEEGEFELHHLARRHEGEDWQPLSMLIRMVEDTALDDVTNTSLDLFATRKSNEISRLDVEALYTREIGELPVGKSRQLLVDAIKLKRREKDSPKQAKEREKEEAAWMKQKMPKKRLYIKEPSGKTSTSYSEDDVLWFLKAGGYAFRLSDLGRRTDDSDWQPLSNLLRMIDDNALCNVTNASLDVFATGKSKELSYLDVSAIYSKEVGGSPVGKSAPDLVNAIKWKRMLKKIAPTCLRFSVGILAIALCSYFFWDSLAALWEEYNYLVYVGLIILGGFVFLGLLCGGTVSPQNARMIALMQRQQMRNELHQINDTLNDINHHPPDWS